MVALNDGVFDLARWKVTLPTGSPEKPTEVAGQKLADLDSPWCKRTADGGVAFRAPVNGVTTKGSKNPRSEGRELDGHGGGAKWQPNQGTNSLTVVEAFTILPDGKPHVVGLQIHDAANDVSVFRLEGNRLYVTHGNDNNYKLIDSNYVLGTKFVAQYVVTGNRVHAYYNGAKVAEIDVSGMSDFYFKAGAYVQANCTVKGVPCNAENVGEVVVYSMSVAHSDEPPVIAPGPGPSTPPASPPPAPSPPPASSPPVTTGPYTVVMLIRHGEKPDSKNKGISPTGKEDSHSLTAAGWQRARGLTELFAPAGFIRGDLYRPRIIYAADGPSAGERMKQTVSFLAARLGVTPILKFDKGKYADLVKTLKALPVQGEVALVCWEHSEIPPIAEDLAGVKISWPDACYDVVLVFTANGKGGWTMRQAAQMIVPGDDPNSLDGKPIPAWPPAPPSPPPPPPPAVSEPAPVPSTPDPTPAPPPVTEPDPVPSWPTPTPPAPVRSWWQVFLDWWRRNT